jgi:hypothetical protein
MHATHGCGEFHELTMTTITDTLYAPNGSVFRGTLLITMAMSQPLYTSGGRTLTQLNKPITISDGTLSVDLEPNAQITPAGTSYTVRYSPAQGAPYTEYWVVPVSGSPVTVSDCRVAQQPAVSVLLRAVSSPPASASAAGTAGTITYDGNYVYVCVAANTWKRAALSSW